MLIVTMTGLTTREQKYKDFVELLYSKCQEVQSENERYVHRIITVKQLLKRRAKEVSMLKRWLDKFNDGWRHVPVVTLHRTRRTELKRGPKPGKRKSSQKRGSSKNRKSRTHEKTQTKRKSTGDVN